MLGMNCRGQKREQKIHLQHPRQEMMVAWYKLVIENIKNGEDT